MPSDFDVIVIGAGAAGIGAGIALSRLKVPHILIEAKERVGGRAHSDTQSLGHLWDRGCHWFHSADRNVLRQIADRLGHGYRKEPLQGGYCTYVDGKPTPSLQRDYVWSQIDAIAAMGAKGLDVPAIEALDRNHPLYPLVNHWVQLVFSVEPEELSTLDVFNYESTGVDRAVKEGYGALIAKLASGLAVHLSTQAQSVTVTRSAVKVMTTNGELTGKAVIVAVPQRVIETGRIAFTPRLPAQLDMAFRNVPMGWSEKIAISFDRQVFDSSLVYVDIFEPCTPENHPVNIELHPFGRPIAIAHTGGHFARDLERQGEEAMVEFAVGTLTRTFGSNLRSSIVRGVATHWGSDDHIGGAYSAARPGHTRDRQLFLAPLHERVFFAGEHANLVAMATAHGAFLSGVAAAHRAAERSGHPSVKPNPTWLPENVEASTRKDPIDHPQPV
jgi:monoamine oxidase